MEEWILDFFTAVKNNNLSLLQVLVQNGADVNTQDTDGMTLLHHAVNGGQLETVKFLIEKGADVTQVSNSDETTLYTAASKNYLHIANFLLESVNHDELKKFIDAKTTTSGTTTALHIASASGFYEMTRLILSRGAIYNIQNGKDERPVDVTKDQAIIELLKKVNIYFELAIAGEEKLYESLEKCSIDEFSVFTNSRNCHGYNLVQIAIVNNHPNLATLLQCLKVALFRVNGHKPTFHTNNFDELLLLATTALSKLQHENSTMEASLTHVHKFVSTFRSFDKRILDPNVLAIEDMLSLLECHQHATSIFELTKQVIEVHLKLFSASIYSVKLLESTRCKNWTLAEKCMAEMAYVNLADEGGWTPLLHAINVANINMVKILLAYGARVNCSTKIGKNTSLHIAVNSGLFEIVELLLERDATSEFINAKTEAKGSTALHVAAKAARLDIVMWLLKCGAIYCLKNKDDQMPVDLTSDKSIQMLFRLIDQLFDEVKQGNIEVIDRLEALSDDEFLAVVLCRNEEGYLLKDVAMLNQRDRLASKITDMLKVLLEEKGFKFNENSVVNRFSLRERAIPIRDKML